MRLSSIIKQFEQQLLSQYRLLPSHRKALSAMKVCRTQQSAKMVAGCDDCQHRLLMLHIPANVNTHSRGT